MKSGRQNLLGYAFLLPAVLIMTLCGILPMAFVAYYSVHDTFGGNIFVWVGAAWFKQVLVSPEFHAGRSAGSRWAICASMPEPSILMMRKTPKYSTLPR